MSVYTELGLIEKLNHMSISQQSIETLSHWIIYQKKHMEKSIKVWEKEIFKAPPERKILFLYLANHVMQSNRKKGNEFSKEFAKVLKPCVVHVYRDGTSQKETLRILDVWKERAVLSPHFVEDIKASLTGRRTSTTPPPPQHHHHPHSTSLPPPSSLHIPPPPLPSSSSTHSHSHPHPHAYAESQLPSSIPTALSSSSQQLPLDPSFLSIIDALQLVQQEEMNNLFLQDEISSLLSSKPGTPQIQDVQFYINALTADIERRNEVVNRVNHFLEEQNSMISSRNKLLDQLLELHASLPSNSELRTSQVGGKRSNEALEETYQPKKQKTENEKFMESLFQNLDSKSLPPNLLPQNQHPPAWNPLPFSHKLSGLPHHTTNL